MARTFVAASSQKLIAASVPLAAVPLTMACWWRPVSAAVGQSIFEINDNGTNVLSVRQDSSGHILASAIQASSLSSATSSTTTTAGVSGHACAVFAGIADRRAFNLGGGKGTDTNSRTPSGINQVEIGHGGGGFSNGDISECAIWNIALADAEVAILAAGIVPWLVHPEALVFYAPLLHGYSPEIELIGGRNLTITGATIAPHPPINRRGRP